MGICASDEGEGWSLEDSKRSRDAVVREDRERRANDKGGIKLTNRDLLMAAGTGGGSIVGKLAANAVGGGAAKKGVTSSAASRTFQAAAEWS
jgi:hypothetical protein